MLMKYLARYSWLLLILVGLAFLYYAYDNAVVIPSLSPTDPERGWAWLTTNPEVIEYIKYWFRILGLWVFVVAMFIIVVSATGFRNGEKWAFFSLLFIPVHIVVHMILWPWAIPILAAILLLTAGGLLLPYQQFFPKS
jgi:hypothetical protein